MKYLVVQDWESTHGNHAGMMHMCQMLMDKYPNEYSIINMKCPCQKRNHGLKGGRISRYCFRYINTIFDKINTYENRLLVKSLKMLFGLSSKDKVFLLEYLHPEVPQYKLAKYVKKFHPSTSVYGLVHLTHESLNKYGITEDQIFRWLEPIDRVLTLGSSLSEFLISIGIPTNKVSTGFHYVDRNYYLPTREKYPKTKLTAIVMGAMLRDYDLLKEIVDSCQRINWIICVGKDDDRMKLFSRVKNVTVYGYIEEEKLKELMNHSNISVSVMTDTAGSNVVTTSLSMGLVQVVSDVGSIRDYCDSSNTIFCQNSVGDFSKAINYLTDNPSVLLNMSLSARKRSRTLVIDNIHEWFENIE